MGNGKEILPFSQHLCTWSTSNDSQTPRQGKILSSWDNVLLSFLCMKASATPWHAVCAWVGDTAWVPLGWNAKCIFSTLRTICRHLALSVVLRPTQAGNRVTSRLCCSCERWVVTQLKPLSVPESERWPSIPCRSLWYADFLGHFSLVRSQCYSQKLRKEITTQNSNQGIF